MRENILTIFDPQCSIWINASAGTGKTKILIDRLIVLLINGAERILCITFTNAAVKEIRERVINILSKWTQCSSEELLRQLECFTQQPNQELIYRARTLFKDFNSKLKIHTIHSYCCELNQTSAIIDEHKNNILIKRSIKIALQSSASVNEHFSYTMIVPMITELINKYGAMLTERKFIESLQGKVKERLIKDITFTANNLEPLVNLLALGSDNEKDRSRRIKLGFPNEDYVSVFLCKDGTPKKVSSVLAKKKLCDNKVLEKLIIDEQQLLIEQIDLINGKDIVAKTERCLDFAYEVSQIYNKLKCGQSTYNDIIFNVIEELSSNANMQYKVDSSLDHLLVDEVQDNSFLHWKIIISLCADFFAGRGSSDISKTVFFVGDVKQSIYGFMGSKPDIMLRIEKLFQEKIESNGYKWSSIRLDQSFRSGDALLNAVDKIFNANHINAAIDPSEIEINHKSENYWGHIELWPMRLRAKKDPLPWIPMDNVGEVSELNLAKNIVCKIESWLTKRRVLKSTNKAIELSDIMVLFQRRSIIISHLISELAQKGMYASCESAMLKDHLVVQDLICIGKFLLDPDDNFMLYSALKSAFFALSEQELFNLFYKEEGSVLQKLALLHPVVYEELQILRTLRGSAFDFYSVIIASSLDKLLKYFGSGVKSYTDGFIECVIQYNCNLRGFLNWIEDADIQIKANSAKAGIRIMTVHGSKGLEAPIIILADATFVPGNQCNFFYDEEETPFWSTGLSHSYIKMLKSFSNEQFLTEHKRLLYVALTRAKEEIYVTGLQSSSVKKNSWYEIINNTDLSDILPQINACEELIT